MKTDSETTVEEMFNRLVDETMNCERVFNYAMLYPSNGSVTVRTANRISVMGKSRQLELYLHDSFVVTRDSMVWSEEAEKFYNEMDEEQKRNTLTLHTTIFQSDYSICLTPSILHTGTDERVFGVGTNYASDAKNKSLYFGVFVPEIFVNTHTLHTVDNKPTTLEEPLLCGRFISMTDLLVDSDGVLFDNSMLVFDELIKKTKEHKQKLVKDYLRKLDRMLALRKL